MDFYNLFKAWDTSGIINHPIFCDLNIICSPKESSGANVHWDVLSNYLIKTQNINIEKDMDFFTKGENAVSVIDKLIELDIKDVFFRLDLNNEESKIFKIETEDNCKVLTEYLFPYFNVEECKTLEKLVYDFKNRKLLNILNDFREISKLKKNVLTLRREKEGNGLFVFIKESLPEDGLGDDEI